MDGDDNDGRPSCLDDLHGIKRVDPSVPNEYPEHTGRCRILLLLLFSFYVPIECFYHSAFLTMGSYLYLAGRRRVR